jgi:hypothetical protein
LIRRSRYAIHITAPIRCQPAQTSLAEWRDVYIAEGPNRTAGIRTTHVITVARESPIANAGQFLRLRICRFLSTSPISCGTNFIADVLAGIDNRPAPIFSPCGESSTNSARRKGMGKCSKCGHKTGLCGCSYCKSVERRKKAAEKRKNRKKK